MSTVYTVNGKVLKNSTNDKWLTKKPVLPPIPANTVRVRTSDGNAPTKASSTTYNSATLVSDTTDVYDVYKSNDIFYRLLYGSNNVIEVLGANTTNVTNMSEMFCNCTSLTSVQLFDTSNVTRIDGMFNGCSSLTSVPLFATSKVTDMSYMFVSCTSLTSVPLFNTSSVTTMSYMFSNCSALTSIPLFNTASVTNMTRTFNGCTNVQSGALALYQQASTQTTPPSSHSYTFNNCGKNTTTGAAELAQIPSSWGGTGA